MEVTETKTIVNMLNISLEMWGTIFNSQNTISIISLSKEMEKSAQLLTGLCMFVVLSVMFVIL